MRVLEAYETSVGYSWTLTSRLADMLEKSKLIYGERDKSFTVLGIEFEENGPQVWYPFSSEYIAIQLSNHSKDDMICGCYELAHESVHLLSPLGKRGANVLEEGLATKFAIDYVHQEFNHIQNVSVKSYQLAHDLVCELLKLDEFAIKKLRVDEPVISEFTPNLLLKHYPTLDVAVANELCNTFDRNAT
ncbi:hypothetical protein [Moritella sp.]|uniref:hypothetical protein n=1 Tax=Moritella sp. TaxID=78556 RepID=UPI001DE17B49|nr:hypothetical protein [Moritella sp.]MCJ8348536.1 hypothetical protein [Moritella sp.]NQZ39051.1 hypothetical protein [Moritella sp.]